MKNDYRNKIFKKNYVLEKFLEELNDDLFIAEKFLYFSLDINENEYTPIFLIGSPRSGTTLLLQWIANLDILAYPTNFISRFYKTPVIAAKIQLLFTSKELDFNNETYINKQSFKNILGKTEGLLSPNEFWYFWKSVINNYDYKKYYKTEYLLNNVNICDLKNKIYGICKVNNKPYITKAMNFNFNIDFLDKLFPNSIFIYTKREFGSNIQSLLEARKTYYADVNKWYSFKIPEYEMLKTLSPEEQTAAQIYYTNKAIENQLNNIPDDRKMIVKYEKFCENPEIFFELLKNKINKNNKKYKIIGKYNGVNGFRITRNEENILKNNKKIAKLKEKYYGK